MANEIVERRDVDVIDETDAETEAFAAAERMSAAESAQALADRLHGVHVACAARSRAIDFGGPDETLEARLHRLHDTTPDAHRTKL